MLLRGSDQSETRTLTVIGLVLALVVAVVGSVILWNPFGGEPEDLMSVVIDTPFVGQGVTDGTAVIMHGVKVGQVKAVGSLPGGAVRLDTDLQTSAVAGLTDTVNIDFRPANYFGVTGINLTQGSGGAPLQDGAKLNLMPTGNFTLQALLSRFRDVSAGALTPQLIQVIDRSSRYTNGLDPLIETVLTVSQTVARVQTVPVDLLARNFAGIFVAVPSFVNNFTTAGDRFTRAGQGEEVSEETYRGRYVGFFNAAANDLFGAVGKVESSHVADLLPVINSLKTLTDVVPSLVKPKEFGDTLVELRTRFEKMFGGTPEQRALQVRIILDNFPGVAAPLGLPAEAPQPGVPAEAPQPGVPADGPQPGLPAEGGR